MCGDSTPGPVEGLVKSVEDLAKDIFGYVAGVFTWWFNPSGGE